MRLIDADVLEENMYHEAFEKDTDLQRWDSGCWIRYRMFTDMLKSTPSAETEIIHCRDCKHYKFSDNRAFGFPVKRCKLTGFEDVDDDDFCSRAERRTDE